MISGGSTTSLPLLFDDKMPEKINNLRIGEALIVGRVSNRRCYEFWNVLFMRSISDIIKICVKKIRSTESAA